MASEGVIFGRFIDFRAALSIPTLHMHLRICTFGVRACMQISEGKDRIIVLFCDNDNIDQID